MSRSFIRLQGLTPTIKGRIWESERVVRIGRSPGIELALLDSSVSRSHAELIPSDPGWLIRDLRSTNGTFINGLRVGQGDRQIQEQDLLQCGNVVLLVARIKNLQLAIDEPKPAGPGATASAEPSLEQMLELLAVDTTKQHASAERVLTLLRAAKELYEIASPDDPPPSAESAAADPRRASAPLSLEKAIDRLRQQPAGLERLIEAVRTLGTGCRQA